jgi:hypothetical protein
MPPAGKRQQPAALPLKTGAGLLSPSLLAQGSVIAFPAFDARAGLVRVVLLMTRTLAANRGASALFSPLFSPEKQGKNSNRANPSAESNFAINDLPPSAGRFEDPSTGEV